MLRPMTRWLAGLKRLVDQFARALKDLSRQAGPVVMFIDTGELLGEALEWLRYAARRSGSKVVWVLGLRLEAESDAGMDSRGCPVPPRAFTTPGCGRCRWRALMTGRWRSTCAAG